MEEKEAVKRLKAKKKKIQELS